MRATCVCCGLPLGATSWSLTICDERCLDAAVAAMVDASGEPFAVAAA